MLTATEFCESTRSASHWCAADTCILVLSSGLACCTEMHLRMWGCPAQIKNAPKPDLSYFKDPNQNPVGDLLKGFTPAGSSVGSVSGPDFITYAPCLVRWAHPSRLLPGMVHAESMDCNCAANWPRAPAQCFAPCCRTEGMSTAPHSCMFPKQHLCILIPSGLPLGV